MNKSETVYFIASSSNEGYQTLPKSEVRKRLQDGTLRQSQLVWDTAAQIWKEVRVFSGFQDSQDLPDSSKKEKGETIFFVATSAEGHYEPLTRKEIRKRFKAGKLRDSQLVWHPEEQVWKPSGSFPNLKKSIPIQPAQSEVKGLQASPSLQQGEIVKPSSAKAAQVQSQAAHPKPLTGAAAQASVPTALREFDMLARIKQNKTQWVYAASILIFLCGIYFWNWFILERPVYRALKENPRFQTGVDIDVHHRWFVVPSSIVIQINQLPEDISASELIDLLTLFAKSTSTRWFSGSPYWSIELAKGSQAQYIFRGDAWKELGQEYESPNRSRTEFILKNLHSLDGKMILKEASEYPAIRQKKRAELLATIYEIFVGHPLTTPDVTAQEPERK